MKTNPKVLLLTRPLYADRRTDSLRWPDGRTIEQLDKTPFVVAAAIYWQIKAESRFTAALSYDRVRWQAGRI